MKDVSLLTAIHGRTARIAVGASTVRGLKVRGVVAAARAALRGLDLRPFGTNDASRFQAALDAATVELRRALPHGARFWGVARKVLNIFVRDAMYNVYLRERYHLARSELLLEVPLDSITAKEITLAAAPGSVPAWPGVKRVTPRVNRRFQAAAAKLAADRRVARVHLDAYWWSGSRDGDAP